MQPGIRLLVALLLVVVVDSTVLAQTSAEEATEGLVPREGFVDLYWDDAEGKVLLAIGENDGAFLYHTALAGGLGSNDVGLDRGLLGGTKVVRFVRIGSRVLLFEENLGFRASSDNEAERHAVADAFAASVVHGFDVIGRSGSRLVLDATDFVVRDAMGIANLLKTAGQGNFTLDGDRSGVNPDVLRSFPDNTELEAWLTFSTVDPGRYVRQVAPDPTSVTLRIRHSLVRLPDDGYAPRPFDPRAGFYGITYVDYATPISAEKERRFIARHRLKSDDDGVVEPIVYYLDRGVPEPIRSALLEGAGWWAEAFEAAGFSDAFKVEMLPPGADALDIRYNVIQWVHRATRGWSWGDTVLDPRTGEIIKGYVALGSLRVRQDYLLAQGLLGTPDPEDSTGSDPALKAALARIRQLSAHEVGHTLGLMHNFAASVADRASVMDYPAPLVRVDEAGRFDHDNAYDVGIGEWDKFAIRYGYTQFASRADETAELEAIIQDRRASGLQFISDDDARPAGGAHPDAHLWDNGPDVVAALGREMDLRRAALETFDLERLAAGRPLATLEDVLVPLYLRHRYQLEATAKLVAGVRYEYALAGRPSDPMHPVPSEVQHSALETLISAVAPRELRIPERVRRTLPPRPPGYPRTRELFTGDTGLIFDAFAPAASIADFVFSLLLHPERTTRLAYQSIEDADQLGLDEMLGAVREAVFPASSDATDPYDRALGRVVQDSWVGGLLRLGLEARSPDVAAAVHAELTTLSSQLREGAPVDAIESAHYARLAARIDRFLLRPFEETETIEPIQMPPGSPIGSDLH